MKLWRLLKIQGSILMYISPPLWPAYIGERKTIFAKAYGMKVRCFYGEHVGEHIVNLGEHIENPLGTYREHHGNMLGNRTKWKKKILPTLQT
jgi:hypothetical protein